MRYLITLYGSPLIVEAESEDHARSEAVQAIIESPDLLVAEPDVDRAAELYAADRAAAADEPGTGAA